MLRFDVAAVLSFGVWALTGCDGEESGHEPTRVGTGRLENVATQDRTPDATGINDASSDGTPVLEGDARLS